jgi:hypothetical protein
MLATSPRAGGQTCLLCGFSIMERFEKPQSHPAFTLPSRIQTVRQSRLARGQSTKAASGQNKAWTRYPVLYPAVKNVHLPQRGWIPRAPCRWPDQQRLQPSYSE